MNDCIDNLKVCNASCCRLMVFDIGGYLSEVTKDYYIKHGCRIIRINRQLTRIVVPSVCKQLDEATNLCKLHNTDEKPYHCMKLNSDTINNKSYFKTPGCIL